MEKISRTYIYQALFWAGLVASWAWIQQQLKQEPQVHILEFGLATLFLLIFVYGRVASVLYYMLMCVLVYNALFCLFMIPLYGHHPTVTVDGHQHPVMDPSWIFAVLLAIITTPFVLRFYYKKAKRNRTFDIAVTLAFLFITLCIYAAECIHYDRTCRSCGYFDW